MFELIRRIRMKPEPARRRIAFAVATILTVIIFVVWLSTLPAKFRNARAEAGAQTRAASPLETLGERVERLFEGFL